MTRRALGDYAKIQQGKYLAKEAMAGSRSSATPIPVHGANGIIGWTDKAMYEHGVPLVTCRGSNCGMVLWAEGPLWVSNNAMAILPYNGLRRFAFYRLASCPPYDVVSGSAQPQITRVALAPREYDFPPDELQPHIERILSALDDKIELNRRMNETLEAQARTLFRDWFVDFGPVKAKMEGEARYLAPDQWSLFPDRLDDEGVPDGWRRSTIGEEIEAVGGSTPSTANPAFWDGQIAWTTPKDLSGLRSPILIETGRRITEAGLSKVSSGLLPAGTVLLSSRAPVGYLAITNVPLAINQGYIAMRCDRLVSNYFAFLWAKQHLHLIVQNANGSTFQEISKRNFRPLPMIVGTDAIHHAFDNFVGPLFDRITANELENRTLARLRDLLLPKLMSGKIRVGHTTDLDELAS